MKNGGDARIRRSGDAYEVVFVRHLKHSVEKVWAAVTVPERIADWFTEMSFVPDLRLGARIEIGFGRQVPLAGEVVELAPPRLLAWTWAHDEHPDSLVRCELAPEPGGCVLTFSQSNMRRGKLAEVAAGWHACLDNLDAASAGRPGVPWSPEREAIHERRYDLQVTALGVGPAEAADGVISKTDDGYEIVFVRKLAKPIEKVWAALTVPERLADWLAEATIEPELRIGARFALHFPSPGYRMAGEIVALQPPRLIAWTWPDPESPERRSRVTFELRPEGAGCILTVTNDGLVAPELVSVAAGWHTHLEGLPAAADGVRTPWSAEGEKVHARRYDLRLAALAGAAANGVIRKTSDGYEIVFVRRLAKPIEKVWAALTVPERIADWFTDMRFDPEPRLGAKVSLSFPDDDPPYAMSNGEVIAFEPPQLFAWTWPMDDRPSLTVRCELTRDGDGCVLTFSESRPGAKDIGLTWGAAGWQVFLDGLEGAADGVRTPGSMEREKAIRPAYEAQLAAIG